MGSNSKGTLRRVLLTVCFIWLIVVAMVLWRRGQWPEEVNQRLAALRDEGTPATLLELDDRYQRARSDSGNSESAEKLQRIFEALPSGPDIVFEPPTEPPPDGDSFLVIAMSNADQLNAAEEFLNAHAEVLSLLHETGGFSDVYFPVDISQGLAAQVPHLAHARRAASILALEAVWKASNGDGEGAVAALMASLRFAELLGNDPFLIATLVQDRIAVVASKAIRLCREMTELPTGAVENVERQVRSIVTRQSLARRLETERALMITILRGSNAELAEFMVQGSSDVGLRLSVEVGRWRGIWQKDLLYALRFYEDLLDVVLHAPIEDVEARLEALDEKVRTQAKTFDPDRLSEVKIVSGMLLPSALTAAKRHFAIMRHIEETFSE